jgi:flavodoxin
MRTLIAYYSYSGNTHKVAEVLRGCLAARGEVEMARLQGVDENGNFFRQAARAFKRVRARIAPVQEDLSAYDLVCIGTPVWAFGPAPSVNAFLDRCTGVKGKRIVLFCTSGGGGISKTFKYMKECLSAKGCDSFAELSVLQARAADREFVRAEFEKVL